MIQLFEFNFLFCNKNFAFKSHYVLSGRKFAKICLYKVSLTIWESLPF